MEEINIGKITKDKTSSNDIDNGILDYNRVEENRNNSISHQL
jgi:hypothetical protein